MKPDLTPEERQRFYAKVERRGREDCWPWTGTQRVDKRGAFYFRGRAWPAPAVSLLAAGKPRPEDKPFACHTCDNPNCVNPDHLWWGSHIDNMKDAYEKGRYAFQRQTHCVKGHPLTGDNVRMSKDNSRVCRTCHAEWRRNHKAKKRLERLAEKDRVAAINAEKAEALAVLKAACLHLLSAVDTHSGYDEIVEATGPMRHCLASEGKTDD